MKKRFLRSSSWRFIRDLMMLFALVPLAVMPPHAIANPTGGQVVAGQVNLAGGAGQLDLTQLSSAAIVNWRDFSIGAGEIVNIHQNANAALLNRVIGANPSELLGQLNANGRVYLVNPNGVLVGKDARIDAGNFFATTSQISDAAFLAGGDLAFSDGSDATIVNLGVIKASDGDAVLVAHRVVNAGEISAPQGTAALVAATDFIYTLAGNTRISVAAGNSSDVGGVGVDNAGLVDAADAQLTAADGNLYALAVNQSGLVRATGVSQKDGRILLTAEGGNLQVDGSMSAHRAEGSGGEILIGGDYQGENPEIATATHTTVGVDAVIDVSAQAAHADAGRAIVWADQQTDFAGKIDGQGGVLGGDGAFAEVSGKHILNYHGLADLSAAFGATGTLLLDPNQAIISTAADNQANGAFNNTVIATNLATANVVVNASTFGSDDYRDNMSGEIIVNAPIAWTSGNTLTLQAGNSIAVNADLTGTGGDIVFQIMGVTSAASVTSDAAATITADSLTIKQNPNSAYTGYNPEPAQYRSINDILLNGVVNVGTLDIKTENAGIEGDITITNAANAIGTLKSSATSGTIKGDINIVDSSGGLIVAGDFSNVAVSNEYDTGVGSFVDIPHSTTIVTTGDLTLATSAQLGSTAGADVVLAAQGGSFINNAGASAITVGTGGRFLIYSDNPTNTTLGGLAATPVYNKTYAANAPGAITQTGNRVLYSLAPTLTFTADNLSRLYGAANPALTYTVSGLVGSDTAGQAYSGTPTVATTALVTDDAGTKAITVAANTVIASDYDYQIAFNPGTLTINPAPLTITADNLAKSQRQDNPTLTATFSGLVNGDTSGDFTGLNLATTADVNSGDGTYAITASGAVNANYDITFVNGVLTVNGLPTLLISADDLSMLYGAAIPAFTSSISGFNSGDDSSIISGLTLTSSAAVGSPVGTYSIVPSGATAAGYLIDFASGTLTINPALLTITANNLSRFYGSANPTLAVTYSGFVNGEDSSVVSGLAVETAATTSSGIGTYAIMTSGAAAPNYAITLNPGTLTVDRAPLTLDVDNLTKTYADLNPTLTASATGLVLNQTLADVGTLSLSTPVTQLTDVGTYAITGGLTGSLLNNYDLTINQGQFRVNQRPITVYATSGTKVYGDANPNIQWGLQGTDPVGRTNLSLLDISTTSGATAATTASGVGSYTTFVTGLSNPNFDITYSYGSLTVTAAPLTIRANNTSRLYGAANPSFTSTATGLKSTDTIADVVGSPEITTPATVTSNVGSYALTPTGTALTSNYNITFTNGTLTVNKAPLFIVPALSSRLYGDSDPTFTISATGLLNGDTADVVQQEQFSGSHPTWGVGPHSITILGATATNYNLTFGAGTMNVFARPLTITANDATREYGDANPTFTANFDNLASFDDAADITGLTITSSATSSSSVVDGGYGISVSSNPNSNYTITYVQGRLTITPASLDFGVGAFTRTYGEVTAPIAPTLASSLKGSDTVDMLGVSVAGPAVTADVGTYDVQVSITNPNYNLTNGSGTLEVLPAQIGVKVGNVARTYGETNPDIADVPLTVSGLAFGQTAFDVLSLDFGVDATANVGNYALIPELFSSNYQISSLTPGNLAVLARQIALKPANVIRYYGDSNPDYEILVGRDGLASFDTLDDVAFSNLLALDGNVVGGFPSAAADSGVHLMRAVLTGNPNYAVASEPGLFVVLPRPITLSVGDAQARESVELPAFSATATNLPTGATVEGVFPDLTFGVYESDVIPSIRSAIAPEDFPIPDGYSDAAFVAKYPAPGEPSRPDFSSGVIVPIETVFPAIPSTEVVQGSIELPLEFVNPNGTVKITDTIDETATTTIEGPLSYTIKPEGYFDNPNYIVTRVNTGSLTVEQDPVLQAERAAAAAAVTATRKAAADAVAAAAAAEEHAAMLVAAREEFYDPTSGYSAYGLPKAALPSLVSAVLSQMMTETLLTTGNSPLVLQLEMILGKEPGSGVSEEELYPLLANIAFVPELKALFSDALSNYVRNLASSSRASYSESDLALIGAVEDRMRESRNLLIDAAKAEEAAWQRNSSRGGLTALYGQDKPLQGLHRQCRGVRLEHSTGRHEQCKSNRCRPGLPEALRLRPPRLSSRWRARPAPSRHTISSSATVGVGQAVGFTTGAAMGGVVASAVIVTAVGSIVRGIQIGNNIAQGEIFDNLVGGDFAAPNVIGMNLDSKHGPSADRVEATINNALLSMALTALTNG